MYNELTIKLGKQIFRSDDIMVHIHTGVFSVKTRIPSGDVTHEKVMYNGPCEDSGLTK